MLSSDTAGSAVGASGSGSGPAVGLVTTQPIRRCFPDSGGDVDGFESGDFEAWCFVNLLLYSTVNFKVW